MAEDEGFAPFTLGKYLVFSSSALTRAGFSSNSKKSFVVHYHACVANIRSVGCLVGFVPFYVKYEKERVDATSRCRLPTRSNPSFDKTKSLHPKGHRLFVAEDEGFEPPCLLGKRFSRPPRCDRFDNPPHTFFINNPFATLQQIANFKRLFFLKL